LKLSNEWAIDDVRRILGIDRHAPFRRQQLIESLLVLGAGFTVYADQKRLVVQRQHVLLEVLGDEGRDLLDTVIGREEGAQADGPVEGLVEFVDVGDALSFRQLEKFLVEPFESLRR